MLVLPNERIARVCFGPYPAFYAMQHEGALFSTRKSLFDLHQKYPIGKKIFIIYTSSNSAAKMRRHYTYIYLHAFERRTANLAIGFVFLQIVIFEHAEFL